MSDKPGGFRLRQTNRCTKFPERLGYVGQDVWQAENFGGAWLPRDRKSSTGSSALRLSKVRVFLGHLPSRDTAADHGSARLKA